MRPETRAGMPAAGWRRACACAATFCLVAWLTSILAMYTTFVPVLHHEQRSIDAAGTHLVDAAMQASSKLVRKQRNLIQQEQGHVTTPRDKRGTPHQLRDDLSVTDQKKAVVQHSRGRAAGIRASTATPNSHSTALRAPDDVSTIPSSSTGGAKTSTDQASGRDTAAIPGDAEDVAAGSQQRQAAAAQQPAASTAPLHHGTDETQPSCLNVLGTTTSLRNLPSNIKAMLLKACAIAGHQQAAEAALGLPHTKDLIPPQAMDLLTSWAALSNATASACRLDVSALQQLSQQPFSRRRVFIAANFRDSAHVLPHLLLQLVTAAALHPSQQVFISIMENHSNDSSPALLQQLQQALHALQVPAMVVSSSPMRRQQGEPRISYLARVRNAALEPAYNATWRREVFDPDTILFVNDVFACAGELLRLLLHDADVACGMDWAYIPRNGTCVPKVNFYDYWVMRDVEGFKSPGEYPYTQHEPSWELMVQGKAFPVHACWNGAVALRAEPFKAGLRLRSHVDGECAASEANLMCDDFHRLGLHDVVVDPCVRLCYSQRDFLLVHGPRGQGFLGRTAADTEQGQQVQQGQQPAIQSDGNSSSSSSSSSSSALDELREMWVPWAPGYVPWATSSQGEGYRQLGDQLRRGRQAECCPIRPDNDQVEFAKCAMYDVYSSNFTELWLQGQQQQQQVQ